MSQKKIVLCSKPKLFPIFLAGNVVTIKLSENHENVLQTDQTYLTMIVETHFQMNYMTGEWKRIKKYRRIENQTRIETQNPTENLRA